MESKSLALWTGVFTLTLLALLVAMVVWMSGGGTRPVDYQLVASQSVAGLRPEAPVLLRGLQVGRLTSMRIDPVDMQKVRMTAKIDPGLHFSRKLHAKLGTQGVTGLSFVELIDDGGGPAFDPERDVIEVAPSMLQEVGLLIPETMLEVRRLAAHVNDILNADNREHIASLLANLDRSSRELPALGKDARAALRDSRALMQSLQALSEQSRGSLARIDQSGGDAARAVSQAADRLGALGERTDRGVLPEVRRAVDELRRTSASLDRLIESQRRDPQQLLRGAASEPPGPGEPGFAGEKDPHQ